jgi:hypothetical protein
MTMLWPMVASTVFLGTQRATRVGGWSVEARARGLPHPRLVGWGSLLQLVVKDKIKS